MGISKRPEYSTNSIVEWRTNQIRPFKGLFDSIKTNLPDTSMLFSEEGIKILQLDNSNTFLVNVKLNGENFEHYYCDPGNQSKIEINLATKSLHDVFKSTTNDDNVLRFIYERDSDEVQLIISSEKKTEYRTYCIKIQNPDDVSYGEISGTADFSYSLTMPCADLQRICKDFKTMSAEKITLSHDGESLSFSCNGEVKTTIQRRGKGVDKNNGAGGAGTVIFIKTPTDCTYSEVFKFSTLYEFSKCQPGGDSKIVRIMMEQGSPLVLMYEIGTLGDMAIAIGPHIATQSFHDS